MLVGHTMSIFKRSSSRRNHELSRPSSVHSLREIRKDDLSGFVMKFQEKEEKPEKAKLRRKPTNRNLKKQISSPCLSEVPPTYQVAIVGAGPAGLCLA